MPRAKTRKRPCAICRRWFTPDPHQVGRQKTCGKPDCQHELHRRKCEQWNRKNRSYYKAIYLSKKLAGFYVYLHTEDAVRQAQLSERRKQLAIQQAHAQITDAIVTEVLLTLIRYPYERFAGVVRRLQGHSPPITAEHVRIILDRYNLDNLGEKGGRSKR